MQPVNGKISSVLLFLATVVLSWIASSCCQQVWAQCPWTRDSQELHADCICDFNLSQTTNSDRHPVNRMSVQCSPVNFERLVDALKQTASIELPQVLLTAPAAAATNTTISHHQHQQQLLEAREQLASQAKLDLLHVSNSSIGQLRANSFVAHFQVLNNQSRQLVVAMQSLHLSRCSINYINQDAFRGIEWSLISLSLTDNLLEWVPVEAMQRLVNLRLLDLSNNRILQVPDGAFRTLTKLSVLRLADNRFGSQAFKPSAGLHAEAFSGLDTSLIELNLKNVQLSSLPVVALRGLSRLAFLNLAQNQISSLESGSFETLTSLTAINLERNRIASLKDGTFNGVETSLNSLSLLGNLLNQFPTSQIARLQNLRRLDMGFNGIEFIPDDAFKENKQLLLVALDGNPLETLPERAFTHLEGSLRSLSVGGRVLNCDCRLSWLIRWQIQYRMLISSRERQPQFCAKPQHFRSLVSFATIRPENLICEFDSTVKPIVTTLSYYQAQYNDNNMRSPTIRMLLPSAADITTTPGPSTTPTATTTTTTTTITENVSSRVNPGTETVSSELTPELSNMVTSMESGSDLEGTESSMYTTTWQRSGVFGERFSTKYDEASAQTLSPTSSADQHRKLSRQGYLASMDQLRKTPHRDVRNRTQLFDKRRRNQGTARISTYTDVIQRMTIKPQAVTMLSTPRMSNNGTYLPPKGARFIDDTPLQMVESINRPERIDLLTPLAPNRPTSGYKSSLSGGESLSTTNTSTTTLPRIAASNAPEVVVHNNTRMSVSSLYRMATSRAPIVVAILDFKSYEASNSSSIQGSSQNNISIVNESPKLYVGPPAQNANSIIHQINGTFDTTAKNVTKKIPEAPYESNYNTAAVLLDKVSTTSVNGSTSTATPIITTTATTTSKPSTSSILTLANLNGTYSRTIFAKSHPEMPRETVGDSLSRILGHHIRMPDLDQAGLVFASFLCFIILIMALSTIMCLCFEPGERAGTDQTNAMTKSTTHLASFSSKSSSARVASANKKSCCLPACCFGSSSTSGRPTITQINSLIQAAEDENNTENSSSRSSNSEPEAGQYGTKTMLIANNQPPRNYMRKSGAKSKSGLVQPVEPVADFWLSRAPSSCDSDKSFSPGANKNNHYNISQAHRAYLAGHAPIQASLFVTSSAEAESGGSSSKSFLKTLKDLYPSGPEMNSSNMMTVSSARTMDDSSGSHLRGARAALHQQSGRSFETGKSSSISRIPAVVSSLGSELTPMSAEEHWPEPYIESLEQEDTAKQEVGSVYYANQFHSNNHQVLRLNRGSLSSAYQTPADASKSTIYQNWLAARRSARQPRNQYQCHELEYPGSPLSSESGGGGLVRYRSIPSLSQHQLGPSNWLRWADDPSSNQPVFETFTSMNSGWCRDNQLDSIYVTGSSKR